MDLGTDLNFEFKDDMEDNDDDIDIDDNYEGNSGDSLNHDDDEDAIASVHLDHSFD